MTQVLITKHEVTEAGKLVQLSCGKTSAEIWIGKDHMFVCCKNASHRVWRGLGKRFDTVAQALDAYKSSAMKSMIQAAVEV